MTKTSSLRGVSLALAAGLAIQSGAAFAVEAHSETAAAPDGAMVEFTVGDVTVAAQMPCAEPMPGPSGPEGMQSSVCIMGDKMFVLAASQGLSEGESGPMASDFDVAYAEIETSPDTNFIEETDVDGRRTMRATRGPDPDFGVMQAVQVAPDALVYAISMSRPNGDEALAEADKQAMRDFVESLEVTP